METNCYLQAVLDTAKRLQQTAEALLALDKVNSVTADVATNLSVRLRVQADTVVSHMAKYADDCQPDVAAAIRKGLGDFKFTYPNLLGEY